MLVGRRRTHYPRYALDYCVASNNWGTKLKSGRLLPKETDLRYCTAIGYTSHSTEEWVRGERWEVDAVGLPPYPGRTYPRVVGILQPLGQRLLSTRQINYLRGDATEPRGNGPKIVAQVVNDKGLTWGAGFALAVRKKWPQVQHAFTSWRTDQIGRTLGSLHAFSVTPLVAVASLVAQHGYGPSPGPRIRYAALESALNRLSVVALETQSSVHMPRIGCGEAGGSWEIVQYLIEEQLTSRGIEVYVYDLPGRSTRRQAALNFSRA